MMPVIFLILYAAVLQAASQQIDCSGWQNSSAVNVTVNSSTYSPALLEGCVAEGVNITLQCAPGSSVVLRDWDAPSIGWLVVTGPPGEEWVLDSVTLIVESTVLKATAGPAVGIQAVIENNETVVVVIRNVLLSVHNSTLDSRGCWAGAASVTVAVVNAPAMVTVTLENVSLTATDSVLTVVADGSATAIGVFLHAEAPSTVWLTNVSLSTSNVTANAAGASCVAGLIVNGSGWRGLATLQNVSSVVSGGVLSASGTSMAAVGGIVMSSTTTNELNVVVTGGAWLTSGGSTVAASAIGTLSAMVAVSGGLTTTGLQNINVTGVTLIATEANITANSVSSSGNASTSCTGGVAVDFAASVQQSALIVILQNTSVIVTASGWTGAAAAAAGGIASGSLSSTQQQFNITVSSFWSLSFISSSSSVGWGNTLAASAFAGLASGVASGTQAQSNITAFFEASYISCSSTSSSSDLSSESFASAAAVGVSAGSAIAAQWQATVFIWLVSSNISCAAVSDALQSSTNAASAALGIAAGNAGSDQVQSQLTGWIVSSNVNSSGSSNNQFDQAWCAASIAGTAAAAIGGEQRDIDATLWVGWSNLTCGVLGTSNSASSVCSIIALGAANSQSTQQQQSRNVWLGWSSVWSFSSALSSNSNGAFAASAVLGLSAAHVADSSWQSDVHLWVGWSNINSTATSSASCSAFSGSSIAAVALGAAGNSSAQQNAVVWLGWSNLSSLARSSSGSCQSLTDGSYSASGIAAVVSADLAGSLLQKDVTLWIGWSSISSGSTSLDTDSNVDSHVTSASAAAGSAVGLIGNAPHSITLQNLAVWIGISTVSCNSLSTDDSLLPSNVISSLAIAGAAATGLTPQSKNASLWAACSDLSNSSTPASANFSGFIAQSGCPSNVPGLGMCCAGAFDVPVIASCPDWPSFSVPWVPPLPCLDNRDCLCEVTSNVSQRNSTAQLAAKTSKTVTATTTTSPSLATPRSSSLTDTLSSTRSRTASEPKAVTGPGVVLNCSWVTSSSDYPVQRGAIVDLAVSWVAAAGLNAEILLREQGLIVPRIANLPAGCVWVSERVVQCAISFASAGNFVVPLMLGLNASDWGDAAPLNVTACASGMTNCVVVTPASLRTVLSGGRTVASDLVISGTQPAMEALQNGTILTVYGQNLDLLPVVLPVGPVLCNTTVGSGNISATLDVLWQPQLNISGPEWDFASTVTAAMLEAYAGEIWALYFINTSLTPQSAAAIAQVVVETPPGLQVDLGRFDILFAYAEVLLNVPPIPVLTSSTVAPSISGNGNILHRGLGIGETAATAITATAYGSVAVAAALSPTAGNRQAVVDRILVSAQCTILDGSDGSFPLPSTWALVPSVVDVAPGETTGAGEAAGEVLSSVVIVLCVLGANVLSALLFAGDTSGWVATVAEAGLAIASGYLGPTLIGTGVTLLRYPVDIPLLCRSAGAVGVVVPLLTIATILWACRLPVQEDAPRRGLRSCLAQQLTSFYDDSRDLNKWYIKLHVFEELMTMYMIGALSGSYPQSVTGCTGACAAMCVLAAAHTVYLVSAWPHKSKVEGTLALMNAFLMLGVGTLSLGVLRGGGASVESALAVAVLTANCFFFIQAIVLCVTGLIDLVRAAVADTEVQQGDAAAVPLLRTVPSLHRTPVSPTGVQAP